MVSFIAQREVCSCAPIFNFFCRPLNFPLGTIIPFFAIMGAVLKPQKIKSHNDKIWYDGVDLGLPSPSQIVYKKIA